MLLAASINPVYRLAAEHNELQVLGVVSTLIFLTSFLYWIWFAYNPKHRERWEAAGRIPFDDDLPGGDA